MREENREKSPKKPSNYLILMLKAFLAICEKFLNGFLEVPDCQMRIRLPPFMLTWVLPDSGDFHADPHGIAR